MNTTVGDAITTELALLEVLVDFPVSPFGFGSDISGATQIAA